VYRVIQLFKGMLYHCVGGDVSDVINKTDCLNKGPPFRWINYKYNFDDLGQVCRASHIFILGVDRGGMCNRNSP